MHLPACLQVFSDENISKLHVPIIIVSVYLLIVMFLAPAYMKNRPPFKLKRVIIVHNFFQVVANAYLSISFTIVSFPHWKYQCGIMHNGHFPKVWEDLRCIAESIFLLKVVGLFDTVFFVLRKKRQNVSFLHVYHHAAVIIIFFYIIATFSVGLSFGFAIVINCIVHSIMYFYYGLAALGPEFKKYLWWKRYLTILQMMQLVAITIVIAINSSYGCEAIGKFGYIVSGFIFTILLLFMNYYRHAFKSKSNGKPSYKEN